MSELQEHVPGTLREAILARSLTVLPDRVGRRPRVGIAAQSALAVAALAVQGFADVETLGGDVPLSLFFLTIAESGECKYTCDRLLMRGVRDHEKNMAARYREELAECEVVREIRQAQAAAGRGCRTDKMKAANAEADLCALGPESCPPCSPL